MAKYIWHILCLNPYVTMSWGIDLDTIESDEHSIEFHVQGYVHKGNVRVTYIDGTDLFQVSLYNEDGSLKETINNVYLDCLTDTIDRHVENDGKSNYQAKTVDWLLNA